MAYRVIQYGQLNDGEQQIQYMSEQLDKKLAD